MLIRATPNACFVMLRNGLTLEVSYEVEGRVLDAAADFSAGGPNYPQMPISQGVWMFREEVVLEVTVGQA